MVGDRGLEPQNPTSKDGTYTNSINRPNMWKPYCLPDQPESLSSIIIGPVDPIMNPGSRCLYLVENKRFELF